ncbi:uncharacterized protein LOC130694140 [Daphnia carinata]|uniref:uncharacterized protein LOC130694140 n=1 Tax=Daphnia carinata TaxID=120202 RepID=UPI002579756F|nr:uncharacterized protein LOC130694140 [Daphnia carinata]
MERRIGVVFLLHVVVVSGAVNETSHSSTILPSMEQTVAVITSNTTASYVKEDSPLQKIDTSLNLIGSGTPPVNVTLDHFYQPAQGDGTKRKSVPRKGLTKEPVKPRKGAEVPPTEHANITTNSNSTFKSKPLASETQKTEDEVSTQPDYTALIVGLSLGIAMVLILASVTYWRLRDVWERRQYKRVDFLIDGLYTDT